MLYIKCWGVFKSQQLLWNQNKIDYLSYRNYNKKVVKKRKKYVIRRI